MGNPFVKDFASRIDTKFAVDSERMTMSEWIGANTHLRKKPFTFDRYPFQKQIADDLHKDLSCIKCSQVGLSEIQIRKYLGMLKRNTGMTGIFTLPDEKMYKRMSQTRIKPIVEGEAVFNQDPNGKPIRSMGIYQIDESFGYVTGNTEGDATSISADFLFHDELDLSDERMIGLFQSRLQNSDWKITQKFSTPTFVGYGIDASFEVSDQHEYFVRCSCCNHWQVPLFEPRFICLPGLSPDLNQLDEIDVEMATKFQFDKAYYCCEKCKRPLDLGNPDAREWVPRYPGRMARGYRVGPLSTNRLDIEYVIGQLLKMKREDQLRGWYNTVLGLPFNDSNARLQETQIRALMKGEGAIEISKDTPVFVGIDVGQTCHIVLAAPGKSGKTVVFDWILVHSDNLVEKIKELLGAYNIVAGTMDRHPYTPLANEIRDLSEGRIIPVEYRGSIAIKEAKDELDNFSHLTCARTPMLDTVATRIRKMLFEFVGYGQYGRQIIEHLQDMVRIEKGGGEPAIWNKLTGHDHFFHALAFLMMAIRYREFINHQAVGDARTMVSLGGLLIPHQNASSLGMKSRSRETMSIGLQGR